MKYSQKTNKKFCPVIEHPVGKYFISFICLRREPIVEFLLQKGKTDGWLTSGFPTPASTVVRNGKTIERPAMPIWYFDTKEEVLTRLKTLADGWREAQNAYVVTPKGFRLIKRGKDI